MANEENTNESNTQEQKVQSCVEFCMNTFQDLALIRAIQGIKSLKADGCFEGVVQGIMQANPEGSKKATTKDGSSPLMWAVAMRDIDTVKMIHTSMPELLDKPNKKGYTPFLLAVEKRFLQGINYLRNVGADVNVKTVDNETAHSLASINVYHVQHLKEGNVND